MVHLDNVQACSRSKKLEKETNEPYECAGEAGRWLFHLALAKSWNADNNAGVVSSR